VLRAGEALEGGVLKTLGSRLQSDCVAVRGAIELIRRSEKQVRTCPRCSIPRNIGQGRGREMSV